MHREGGSETERGREEKTMGRGGLSRVPCLNPTGRQMIALLLPFTSSSSAVLLYITV
jgi:hypothetical protein